MMLVCGCSLFFFFQAEDGIRDLVRSRGLGDVYKRQAYNIADSVRFRGPLNLDAMRRALQRLYDRHPQLRVTFHMSEAVSYTHLTLPTSDLV